MQSMASISLAKRLSRLPLGVHSKKDMGERSTFIRRSMCKWREAMMPQMEMATVVPKMATPEEKGMMFHSVRTIGESI